MPSARGASVPVAAGGNPAPFSSARTAEAERATVRAPAAALCRHETGKLTPEKSKVRRLRLGHRPFVEIEVIGIVLGAVGFDHLPTIHPVPVHPAAPRLGEGAAIFGREARIDRFAVGVGLPALHA